ADRARPLSAELSYVLPAAAEPRSPHRTHWLAQKARHLVGLSLHSAASMRNGTETRRTTWRLSRRRVRERATTPFAFLLRFERNGPATSDREHSRIQDQRFASHGDTPPRSLKQTIALDDGSPTPQRVPRIS